MPMSFTPGQAPGRHGTSWNAANRTISFFAPTSIDTFRADPPEAWTRSWNEHGQAGPWQHSFGGRLHVGGVVTTALENKQRHAWGQARNTCLARRPGLDAQTSFYDAMQPEARDAAAPIGGQSWRVYAMVVRCPHALDLARTNPALAVGLATRNLLIPENKRVQWVMRTARRLARRRRREIAGAIGLPATEATVRLLARVPADQASMEMIAELQPLLADPAGARMMSHLARLNLDVVTCARFVLEGVAAHSLLEELAAEPWRRWHFGGNWGHRHYRGDGRPRTLLRDVRRMAEEQGRPLPVLRSWGQLCRLHDELAANAIVVARRAVRQERQTPFPEPPVAGTEHIVPLRSAAELAEEAAAQHNCLASPHFVRECLEQHYYVYRVLQPERASLAIAKGPDGVWRVDDLTARFNRQVRPATRSAVARWLAAAQPGARSGGRHRGWYSEREVVGGEVPF